jgi:NADH-quinone oxidoreductase subunit G
VRVDGTLRPATWAEAFSVIAAKLHALPGDRIGAIAGDLCDAESMIALKDLLQSLGSANFDCRQDGARLEVGGRRDFYLFNTTIAGIDEADALLLIGTNPRREAPVLNARLRRRWVAGGFPIAAIGAPAELTYQAEWLGESPTLLTGLRDGSHPFVKTLGDAGRPMIIVGQGALARRDGSAVLAAAWQLAASVGALSPEWHGFNILHRAAARVGALTLGFLPAAGGKSLDAMMRGGVDLLWLLGADEFDTGRIGPATFVVYQGHHGDRGAARADVILPGAAYTEKSGTYLNTEGRVQQTALAVYPPGEAREDWRILRALSEAIGKKLPYDDLAGVRSRLAQVNADFTHTDGLVRYACPDNTGPSGDPAQLDAAPLLPTVANYYQTDPISRASPTMALCTETYAHPTALAAE